MQTIYYTSPWIPVEWIKAHGLEPRGIWSRLATMAPGREGVCSFALSIAEWKRAHPGALLVTTTACDQLRRAADAVFDPGTCFLFNVPATWQSPAARQLYRDELVRLGRFLQRCGGTFPVDEKLAAALEKMAEHRERMRCFVRRNRGRTVAEALMRFASDASLPCAGDPIPASGVPVALVGGPLLPSHCDLFNQIAAAGGTVVLNDTEPGERALLLDCKEQPGARTPFDRMADLYFDSITDVFQRPNMKLYEWLVPELHARGARGIILWAHVGCDLWRAEAASLREACGLPLLLLEPLDTGRAGLRESNRLAAFIESLHEQPAGGRS